MKVTHNQKRVYLSVQLLNKVISNLEIEMLDYCISDVSSKFKIFYLVILIENGLDSSLFDSYYYISNNLTIPDCA